MKGVRLGLVFVLARVAARLAVSIEGFDAREELVVVAHVDQHLRVRLHRVEQQRPERESLQSLGGKEAKPLPARLFLKTRNERFPTSFFPW